VLVALQALVGLVIVTLGANLFVKAPDDAAAMHEMSTRWFWKQPAWMEVARMWSNRFAGVFLVGFGLAICVGAFL